MAWYDEHGEKERIESVGSIPPYNISKEPFYYDFQKEKWIYKDDLDTRRANDDYKKGTVEDIIEEKLKEGVDGYKEDTYWGESYEFNDKD